MSDKKVKNLFFVSVFVLSLLFILNEMILNRDVYERSSRSPAAISNMIEKKAAKGRVFVYADLDFEIAGPPTIYCHLVQAEISIEPYRDGNPSSIEMVTPNDKCEDAIPARLVGLVLMGRSAWGVFFICCCLWVVAVVLLTRARAHRSDNVG